MWVEKIDRAGLCVGGIPWGTHFCQFYNTSEDLLSILVPYFKAGLKQNELCISTTSEPLDEESVKRAMIKAVPGFARYIKKRQFKIILFPTTSGI